MVTIKDVARRVGVSPSTVSKVLNGYQYVCAEPLKIQILETAQKLGYKGSPLARSLRKGCTYTIAVITELPDDPHGAPMLAAVHQFAMEHNFTVTILPLPYERGFTEIIDYFRSHWFDIIVLAYTLAGTDELLENIHSSRQILVGAGDGSTGLPQQFSAVYWDDHEGFAQIAQHLFTLGHRHVAFLTGNYFETAKANYLAQVCVPLGIRTEKVGSPNRCWANDFEAGRAQAREVLQWPQRPTAIVTRTDDVALGALHALLEAGIRVPQDISLVGYYDFSYARYLCPSLTTTYTPFKECALMALQWALEIMEQKPRQPFKPRFVKLPTELRIRKSTGPAPG